MSRRPPPDPFTSELLALLPHLKRFAYSRTKNPAAVEDLVQSTVERALAKRDRYRPDSNMKAWCFRIMINLHINEFRSGRTREDHFDEALASTLPANVLPADQRIEARETVERISDLVPEQRQVLVLIADGMAYQDAADCIGIGVGTVKSRLSRARDRLRHIVERTTAPHPPQK